MDEAERAHWERGERERGFILVRVRLLTTDEGGRKGPIADGYRASWDIGNRSEEREWTINDAPLLLDGRDWLAPGESANVRIHPFAPEFWTLVSAGAEIAMHEGRRIVGRGKVLEVIAAES
jgi:translation elongation factor EF-Tu-like GTPase